MINGVRIYFSAVILFVNGSLAFAGCDDKLEAIGGKSDFVIAGYGGVGEATTHLLLRDFPDSTITVVDFQDKNARIAPLKDRVRFVQTEINRENLPKILDTHLKPGGAIIDAAWYIATEDFVKNANRLGATYQNTSLEQWRDDVAKKQGVEMTLYHRHREIDEFSKKMGSKSRTAVLENGANPGWVTHALRMGLLDIAHEYIKRGLPESRTKEFKDALAFEQFGELARILNTRVIHIAELDTQDTRDRREKGKFYGVWSIDGLFSEGNEPAEGSFGTHEKKVPEGVRFHSSGPQNQFYMDSNGFRTIARSSTPGGLIFGNIIPHGETNDNEMITRVERDGKLVFRTTNHYVYQLPKKTRQSLLEWRKRDFSEPGLDEMHYMNTDIAQGADQLGILLLGSKVGPWWTGSLLDVDAARKEAPPANATTIQVAANLVATQKWLKKNPNRGLLYPRDLPYAEFMKDAKPRLEPWYSGPVPSPVKLNPLADGSIPDSDLQLEKFLVRPKR